MGDRANIVVLQNSFGCAQPPVYLYTHWGGSELWRDLQEALGRKVRWDDDCYLTRIIFDQMTAEQHGNENGFGISTYRPDNEYNYLVVDVHGQKIYVTPEENLFEHVKTFTFDEFLELKEDPR